MNAPPGAHQEAHLPLPRFAQLPPERQAQLLTAATAEFVEHGPDRASLNRILGAVNLSKGVFYYYFRDKADLYATVLTASLGDLDDLLPSVAHIQDAAALWAHLQDTMTALLNKLAQHPHAVALLRTLYTSESGAMVLPSLLSPFTKWIGHTLTVGQRLGAVRTDVPIDLLTEMTLAAGTAIDRWFSRNLDALSHSDVQQLTIATMSMLRGMLAPPQPVNSPER